MLQVQNIEKYYGSQNQVTKALDRVSFTVEDGAFIAIMGASGSGKTTLLNCISTIDTVSAGSILLEGRDITQLKPKELARFRRENLGFIFQDFNLIPILTAEENIIMPLLLDGKKPDKTKLRELAKFLGIENRLKHLPGELSGGQRQRVAIARALINNPVILLADEPTGNLDKKAADEIMELLLAVNRRGNTVLLVTHEQRYADLCGRRIEISDGRIII